MSTVAADETPAFRYTAELAGEIEQRWQQHWEERGTFHAPNPVGPLKGDVPDDKLFVQDMFRTRRAPACTSATRWASSAPTCSPGTTG